VTVQRVGKVHEKIQGSAKHNLNRAYPFWGRTIFTRLEEGVTPDEVGGGFQEWDYQPTPKNGVAEIWGGPEEWEWKHKRAETNKTKEARDAPAKRVKGTPVGAKRGRGKEFFRGFIHFRGKGSWEGR